MRLALLLPGVAFLAIAVLLGADRVRNGEREGAFRTAAEAVAASARDVYQARLEAATREPGTDRAALLSRYRTEIGHTLDVPVVLTADSVAVALLRYSLGDRVYHDALWLRRVGDTWHRSHMQRFSSAAADPFHDKQPERARDMIARADAWIAAGASRWW